MKRTNTSRANRLGNFQENTQVEESEERVRPSKSSMSRRSFLGKSLAVGAGSVGAGFLINTRTARASGGLTPGDAAILRFLAAAEILESDLWEQYWELGGVPFGESVETPRGETAPRFRGGNAGYTAALKVLDGDMPQ